MSKSKAQIRQEIIDALKDDGQLAFDVIKTIEWYDGSLELDYEEWDEDFFKRHFGDNPEEAARATFFGDIQGWDDDYIGFNAYGNLKSASKYDVMEEAKEMAGDAADLIIDDCAVRREVCDCYDEIAEIFEGYEDDECNENRRPKAKGKAPTKKGTNKPPVKKKPTTSRKPTVKANKDGSASIRSLKKIQSKRSPAAVKADERKKAKNTIHKKTKTGYKSVSMSDAKKWAKSPGSMDIQGVDTKPKYPKKRK